MTSIGDRAFGGCSSLESITADENNNSYYAVNNCLIDKASKELVLGCKNSVISSDGSVTSIGYSAFEGCSSLTGIETPESVTSVGEYAFFGCYNLTSTEIPAGVTSIGTQAFYYCYRLVEIYNRSSLTIEAGSSDNGYVGYYALKVYTNGETSSNLTEDENGYVIYTEGEEKILVGYNGTETDLVLPGGITKINRYAFYEIRLDRVGGGISFSSRSSLTSIVIPESVTSIGDDAFDLCDSLTSVTFGENSALTSIGDFAFWSCSSLTSIEIPESVTSIGYGAFDGCISLRSVTFGENSALTSIGQSAFYRCSSLESIEIPESVTSIENYTFSGCYNLKSIYYTGSAEDWDKISIGSENKYLTKATRYYYSESNPFEGGNAVTSGNYWHYDENGEIVVW